MNLALAVAILLTWHASPTQGVSYAVWRAKGSCSGTFVKQATTKALTYTESVQPGTYCWFVRAELKQGQSAPSNKVLISVH